MNIEEFLNLSGISAGLLWNAILNDKIKPTKVDGKLDFTVEDLYKIKYAATAGKLKDSDSYCKSILEENARLKETINRYKSALGFLYNKFKQPL